MEKRKAIRDMQCLKWDNVNCIHTPEELSDLVEEAGFLPLFRNDIKGFSVEEHTAAEYWWTKDPERDPWLWRVQLAQSDNLAYGKFFNKKAGFISKEWFSCFANYRRNGYDFDSLYEDGYAKNRCKKIMDLFEQKEVISSIDIKRSAGFGKNGEKNFNGILTELQMQLYLIIREFHKKKNKNGVEYGLSVGYYAKPESVWGYDYVTSCYKETRNESRARMESFLIKRYPDADKNAIEKFLDK